MKTLTVLSLVAIGGALFLLSGCGDDNGMMSRGSDLVVATVPAAGESAYDPAAPIHIKFGASMDTSRFHERFFILDATMHDLTHDSLGRGMMNDSMMTICDSMNRGMTGGNMSDMMGMMDDERHMADTAAFYRRMHNRGMRGRFQWNTTRDSCVFMPDSTLMGNRDYVIMMRSMGGQMYGGHDDGIMGNGPDDLMIRFHTR